MAPPTHRLTLRHPDGVTEILVGAGALEACREELAAWAGGRTLFVLSTPRLRQLHDGRLAALGPGATHLAELEVEDGEGAKSLAHAGRLWEEMLAAGGKRDSRLVNVGGGSVGDLGGFVAGCFLRGIGFAQVPTTLLAQVDAALGGKTGLDLPAGKNTVGLFHHPHRVISDTGFLTTLPRGELRSGLVEVVKMALLLDPGLLERVEAELPALLAGDPEALTPVVAASAAAKIGVVERDPTEAGERKLLNFGHTLGHAVEAVLGYRGLRHGEAVAYGILFALRLAEARGLETRVGRRIKELLARLELPPLPELAPDELVAAMRRDKKARESGLAWVLPAALGRGEVVRDIGFEAVRRELEAFVGDPWG
jgi:3-dehydroquinate synthase